MAWFYERQTNTLILRPILPLEQRRIYAVVVTDRLHGMGGEAVRSPFDEVHHLRQTEALARLPEHFAAHPNLYGDLAVRGWEGVAFAFTFTRIGDRHPGYNHMKSNESPGSLTFDPRGLVGSRGFPPDTSLDPARSSPGHANAKRVQPGSDPLARAEIHHFLLRGALHEVGGPLADPAST